MKGRRSRVLFLVDHKYRDLAGLALIGMYLKHMGYSVKYVALWQEDEIIRSFDPGAVVLNKPIANVYKSIDWQRQGRKIIIINTEGNSENKVDWNIIVTPDLYFFWNKATMDQYGPRLDPRGTRTRLVGSPRIDFYNTRFRDVFPSRQELLSKYKLPDQRTITIATSSNHDLMSEEELSKMEAKQLELVNKTTDYFDEARNQRQVRKILEQFLLRNAEKLKDVNIVLKPHPNEDVRAWQKFFEQFPYDNVRLILGEPINNLLNLSDLHIAHNVCTTIFEAFLVGIPTVEIFSYKAEELYDDEHLGLGKYIVSNVEELEKAVKTELYGEENDISVNSRGKIDEYAFRHFYKTDGFRCLEHAIEMDEYLRDASYEKKDFAGFFSENKTYIRPYMDLLVYQWKPKIRSFIKTIILWDLYKKKKQDDPKLDVRGRYDNRIKPGDEEEWFDRFEAAGLDAGKIIEDYHKTRGK